LSTMPNKDLTSKNNLASSILDEIKKLY
jgi:hypothetical protein